MTQPIISVHNLGKSYRIGLKEEKYPTFRDAIVGAVKAPIRRFQKLREHGSNDADTFWALRGVSFEVQRGEVIGIIGRNGAGKSTLLKILSRITEPTEGEARLRGRVASLLEVGTGFHPELTGRENIYLNGAILGMKKAEIDRKFDEIVAFSEVEKFLDTPVKRYSSGMYVRLAFAVAAHLEPEILIVDEVLAVGDAQFQKKCLGKMQDVASGEGRTVLFVSHNMAAVRALCRKSLMLQEGMIANSGATEQIVSDYLNSLDSSESSQLPGFESRSGAGKVRITEVRMIPAEGNAIACGKPLRIEFHLSSPAKQLRMVFALYDDYGSLVADFDTGSTGPEGKCDFENCIICCIDELLLTPKRYRMNIYLTSCGELQDHVQGAATMHVTEGVVRGKLIDSATRGTTIIPHSWMNKNQILCNEDR